METYIFIHTDGYTSYESFNNAAELNDYLLSNNGNSIVSFEPENGIGFQ